MSIKVVLKPKPFSYVKQNPKAIFFHKTKWRGSKFSNTENKKYPLSVTGSLSDEPVWAQNPFPPWPQRQPPYEKPSKQEEAINKRLRRKCINVLGKLERKKRQTWVDRPRGPLLLGAIVKLKLKSQSET